MRKCSCRRPGVNVNSTYWEGLGPFNDPLLSTQGNAFDLALVQADWQWEGMQGVVGPNVTDGYAYKNNGWDGAYDLGAALTWTIPQLTAGNQTDFLTTANPLYDVVVYWGSNEGDVFIPRMFDNGGAHYSLTDLPAITVGTTTHGPGYQAQAYIGGYQYLQVITQQDPPPGAVPEPGTWLLLGGSLLGLCVGGFRRFVRK
ncbi:MAG: PEP-CTERM sorting domain-containing protein [bacterium]